MDPAKAFMVMEVLLKHPDKLAAGAPGPMWESIYCSRKVAYGCGKHGRKVVEGLTLYVRRPDHPDVTCSMTIRLSDEALRSIKAELGASRSSVEARGFVKIATQGLLVLHVIFRVHALSHREYYLIYDSTDASLYMVPCLTGNELVATSAPVPRRVGRDPQLVLMGHGALDLAQARPGSPLPVHSGGDVVVWHHRPVGQKGAALLASSWLVQGRRDVLVRRQGLLGRSLAQPRVLRPARWHGELSRAVGLHRVALRVPDSHRGRAGG
ncbi:unnamed protein product [Urochloa humidicola]